MQLVLFTHTMLLNIHTHIEGPAMRRNAVNPVPYYNTIPLNSPEFPKTGQPFQVYMPYKNK